MQSLSKFVLFFFPEMDNLILKFTWNCQSKTILEKQNKVGVPLSEDAQEDNEAAGGGGAGGQQERRPLGLIFTGKEGTTNKTMSLVDK